MKNSHHQPICLAKFKKQSKENMPQPQLKPHKESLEYDLMLFQESLELQKGQPNKPHNQSRKSRQPLGDTTNFFSQTMPYRISGDSFNVFKEDNAQQLGSTGPVMTRNEFNKNFRQLKSIHKTTVSYKPSLSLKRQNKIQLSCNTPVVVNQIPSLNCNKGKQKELLYKERIELMQKSYDQKVSQLIEENQRLIEQMMVLKNINQAQEKEKNCIIQRMDMVEQQMKDLLQDQEGLQEIQAQLIKLQPQGEETFTQTQICLNEKQTQTLEVNFSSQTLAESACSEVEMNSINWCTKARSLKGELQWYKVHCNNLTSESKISLENKQIQWSQKYDMLQKQYDQLNQKFISKCSEIKEKDQLINRFLGSK